MLFTIVRGEQPGSTGEMLDDDTYGKIGTDGQAWLATNGFGMNHPDVSVIVTPEGVEPSGVVNVIATRVLHTDAELAEYVLGYGPGTGHWSEENLHERRPVLYGWLCAIRWMRHDGPKAEWIAAHPAEEFHVDVELPKWPDRDRLSKPYCDILRAIAAGG